MKNELDHEQYIFVEFTSSAGNKYEVGYPKAAGYTKEILEVELAKVKDIGSGGVPGPGNIYCVPDEPGQVSEAAKKLGISAANVKTISDPQIYTYKLDFYNTRGWFFVFTDEFPDTYSCSTIFDGWHSIRYNSAKPTMVNVA
jgi:hypothetical protein